VREGEDQRPKIKEERLKIKEIRIKKQEKERMIER
jgi:hypothetical protein